MYYIHIQEHDGISYKPVFHTTGKTPQDVWTTIDNYKLEKGSKLEYGFKDNYGQTILAKEQIK
jgi:hypothetical protein